MTVAPIALFAFNRPRHLKKTIDALAANSLALDSELYVFSDAPRSQDDYKLVEEVRHLIQNITGFKKVVPVFRAKNFGLADSITDGVTFLMKEYGKTIVVEDDIVTSPNFLEYMNSALDLYENHEKVMHIAAYLPPIKSNDLPETFFLNQTSCWGWASWARAWKHFSRDIKNIKEFYNLQKVHEFNLNGAYDYWSQLLANEQGTLKTWAIYWYAHVFARGGLCLHPRDSLVQNIGFDGSGQNCIISDKKKDVFPFKKNITIQLQEISPQENIVAALRYKKYFSMESTNIFSGLRAIIRRLLP